MSSKKFLKIFMFICIRTRELRRTNEHPTVKTSNRVSIQIMSKSWANLFGSLKWPVFYFL